MMCLEDENKEIQNMEWGFFFLPVFVGSQGREKRIFLGRVFLFIPFFQ